MVSNPADRTGFSLGQVAPAESCALPAAEEVKATTCYMCACRCGIKVHLKNGRIRYIEGNRDHPVNRGVLCAKGAAGAMQHYSPARLTKPLKRVGERGSGAFEEIEWEEALALATGWLSEIRETDPRRLAFFTGRDQSQALTGWWAQMFGTPNYAAHGGFCSVNMAAAGLYTLGGSFWEFGEPDWDHTRYLLLFGVAEDHGSNPIKRGLAKLKARGAKILSINPIRTGYSAIADEWLGIRPGSDGLFILALIHELLSAGKVDLDFLAQTTNAPWLVIQDEGAADDGLFARDEDGQPLVWDRKTKALRPVIEACETPALKGEVVLPDGRRARPAFELLARRCLDPAHAPEAAAARCGIEAATIRRIAAELAEVAFDQALVFDQPWTDWAGRRHDKMVGRPVSVHAMRGISAHSNGFHTCRILHLLQVLLGAVDTPGSFRYKPPYPKPVPPPVKPAGRPDQVRPGMPLPGPPLGFPRGPEDLLIDAEGRPQRIDKAFSWDAPLANHGMMHSVIVNAWKGDPYPIDTLFMYMANMAWNSAMNTAGTMKMLSDKDPATGVYKIPHIIYADAYYSEMVAYADLVLPDTTYLERWDCMSLLDRPISEADGPADSIRRPVVAPDRDVRPFQDVLLDLGARLGLPGFVAEGGGPQYPGGYSDYLVNHERQPGVGSLAGWRGPGGAAEGIGAPNPAQLDRYIENGCYWHQTLPLEQRYFRHVNRGYLDYAAGMKFLGAAEPVFLQLYCEELQRFRLAARGHGALRPPADKAERIEAYFDPLPLWYPPFEDEVAGAADYPLSALTQRPMAMYHSWGGQNAWLRQIMGANRLYVPRAVMADAGLKDDDWAWVISRHDRVKAQVRGMDGVSDMVVWTWNAIGKRAGAWNLAKDVPEATTGFLLNHIIDELLPARDDGYRYANADPITGQAAWFDLRVRLEPAAPEEAALTSPFFDPVATPRGLRQSPGELRYGAEFRESEEST